MPFEVTHEEKGFYISHKGSLSFEEIAEANDQLFVHEGWVAHRYQIWNFLEAWALDGDIKDARVISKVDKMNLKRIENPPIKIAFVCTNFKTNEIIEAYIEAVDKGLVDGQIFSDEDTARNWAEK